MFGKKPVKTLTFVIVSERCMPKFFSPLFLLKAALSMSTWRPSEDHERFHIDSGPRINALQVISEALDIPQQQDDEDSCQDNGQHLLNSDTPYNSSTASTTKTIVASDGDVSNGFVKSGRSLPYVFEASESGNNFAISL